MLMLHRVSKTGIHRTFQYNTLPIKSDSHRINNIKSFISQIRFLNGTQNEQCETCKINLPGMNDGDGGKKKKSSENDICPKLIKLELLGSTGKVTKGDKKDSPPSPKEKPIISKETKTAAAQKTTPPSAEGKGTKSTGKECPKIGSECQSAGNTKAGHDRKAKSAEQSKEGSHKPKAKSTEQSKEGSHKPKAKSTDQPKEARYDQKAKSTEEPKEKQKMRVKFAEVEKKMSSPEIKSKIDFSKQAKTNFSKQAKIDFSKQAKPVIATSLGTGTSSKNTGAKTSQKKSAQKGSNKILLVGLPVVLIGTLGVITVLSIRS